MDIVDVKRVIAAAGTSLVIGAAMLIQPAAQAQAQTVVGTVRMSVDSPTAGADVMNGNQVDVGGWAIDTSGPGTGVDQVRIYLDGPMDAGGSLLGDAGYGRSRADVAGVLGSSAYINSGFDYLWTPMNLSAGNHTLYIYVHSVHAGWQNTTVSVNVTGQSSQMQYPPNMPGYQSGMAPYQTGMLPPPPPPIAPPFPIVPIRHHHHHHLDEVGPRIFVP